MTWVRTYIYCTKKQGRP